MIIDLIDRLVIKTIGFRKVNLSKFDGQMKKEGNKVPD